MESLSETKWDLLIEGTGLKHSLLALALSRSDKKILHVDENQYYGDEEAAFSLQEVERWVNSPKKTNFSHACIQTTSNESSTSKLGPSRAYNLTLSPQIIYSRSKLISTLVSSQVYKQLEFQAVGSWFLYDDATLKRLPSGREDIFQDNTIDNRAKRSLMKFLKFVVDFENQLDVWQGHADEGLAKFLAEEFKLPERFQTIVGALTLSLDAFENTKVEYALPRIHRHLTSIGAFGPGFGAVVPKWGGAAEIAQVACRAGAVGGGVYVLGTGITRSIETDSAAVHEVELSNSEIVKTKYITRISTEVPQNTLRAAKAIAVVSMPLSSLFVSTVEGSPIPAVSVVVFPANTISTPDLTQPHPVYIMVHSSETGECPAGQCVLYATTVLPESTSTETSKSLLNKVILVFLETVQDGGELLYNLYYEQQGTKEQLDLAFNDQVLEDVETEWKRATHEDDETTFMVFEERNGMDGDDDGEEF